MKTVQRMTKRPMLHQIGAVAIGIGLWAGASQAQDTQTFDIPLSNPGQQAELEIDLVSGKITVIGEDRDDLELSVSSSGEGGRRVVTPSGTRPIPIANYALEIEERNNAVEVDSDWRSRGMHIVARVPVNTNLKLDTVHEGDIEVSNVSGVHELSSVHGPITATGIRGTIVADTVHGEVTVEMLSVDFEQAMAFSNVHGDIDLSFPAKFGANFTIETRSEEIYSDFEVDIQPTKPTMSRDNKQGGVSFKLEQALHLSINGGGVPVRIETLQGDVHLRKSDG